MGPIKEAEVEEMKEERKKEKERGRREVWWGRGEGGVRVVVE